MKAVNNSGDNNKLTIRVPPKCSVLTKTILTGGLTNNNNKTILRAAVLKTIPRINIHHTVTLAHPPQS